jgi:2-methylcitrate dehydratase PrpD
MSSTVTSEVVDFLLRRERPPEEVRKKALINLIDGFAVMLAGSRTECAGKVFDLVREGSAGGPSSAIGFGAKVQSPGAALVNGTSGHADDYDDTQLSTSPDRIYGLMTHPTVPVLAAALAVGEEVGCSGGEFMDAFMAGFEVECKLAEAIDPDHYRRGFHSTGTMGAFGACAAASWLMGLGEDEARYAIGITSSLTSGIRVNFGTMTKPLHAGMAASNGVTAARLGARGFTSDLNALDGRWGFMQILGGGMDAERVLGKLGSPYALVCPGASVKMYPCGVLGQPSMDAMQEVVIEEDLMPEDVRQVRLRAGPNILEPLRYASPVNGLQAKFSLNFGLGCILVHRKAGLREYTTEVVRSPQIQEAMVKVQTVHDEGIAAMGVDKMRSILEVELNSGRVIERVVDKTRGTPEKPIRDSEIDDKFRDCASFALSDEDVEALLEEIRGVDGRPSLEGITSFL